MTQASHPQQGTDADIFRDGYAQAKALLHDCHTEHGFLATPTENANYRRVWGRDGVILGLAALLTGDAELQRGFRHTLETLAHYQGPHGEIPSNVDPVSQRVSYGGTAGRVDANLWFLIGCGEYWHETGDDEFLQMMWPAIERVQFLLGAWEFNNRGLLYVPQTGDWADEYIHHGYVLYDQLLYLQAQRTIAALHGHVYGSADHALLERISRLRHLIRANYWFAPDEGTLPDDAYHEVLFEKGWEASRHRAGNYWMPFFSPSGYGYRFDAFANVLVSLIGVADKDRRAQVDDYIDDELVDPDFPLLPAFWPVIRPLDTDWEQLQQTFSYTFRNRPHEYHNGGLWPMITGFYVAALAVHGEYERGRRFLEAVHRGNALSHEGEPWGFPEFVDGERYQPGGNQPQGWSAAGAVIGHHALEGRPLFRIEQHD